MTENEIVLPDGLDVETATDVLREFATADDAQVVSESKIDALRDEIESAKEAFAALLAEESPQSADTLARQDLDALTEPFRDEEGEIEVDTLRQTPETGDTGSADTAEGDTSEWSNADVGLGTKESLDTLNKKRRAFENRDMEDAAARVEAEMVEEAGAPDFDTLQSEVLA